ncbi:UNKNOWN [Stylonychia lemnae]|uniref:ISXO2-like transposase domain-containing protein n=1 Tax=Stylonychia lemnae TaxID=5949 RepID=A0A078AFV8_STYLE|nr:UNKNOWN [Stylonychia lemnae]|eukprot:CDW79773.1 UNKNOWN [Stylonychia lemnae]
MDMSLLFQARKINTFYSNAGPQFYETLIGQQRWSYMGHFPQLRWVFGLLCRRTRIPVMYFIKDKSHKNLVDIIKRHTVPGTVIFSDSHSSYVNMPKSKSKLTQYGYYHYWICHITRYVHEKFGFVHTSGIELQWNNMKKSLKGLRYASTEKVINEYVNNHTFRTLYHKAGLHDMVLKALRHFFDYSYNQILELSGFEEFTCPNLWKLDDYIKHLKEGTCKEQVNSLITAKMCKKDNNYWQIQEDLFNCVKPLSLDVIPQDVMNYLEIENARGKKLCPFVRNIFIPVSHVIEYREFWEDTDNDKIGLEKNEDEYKDYCISSLKKVTGERDYYRKLKEIKETQVIDMVEENKERDDEPGSVKLTFMEKFVNGRALKNKNQFLINKSKPLDWGYLDVNVRNN